MKKILMILGGAALLAGCTLPFLPKKITSEAPKEEIKKEEAKPFSGLMKDVIALGVPMQCTYQLADGITTTGYIKGKMYAGESMVQGKVNKMVVKDDCFWSWSEETKKGMTLCMKDLPSPKPGASPTPTSIWDDKNVEAGKLTMNCVPAMVEDALFIPPSDVVFTDTGKMMQGVSEMMQKIDTKKLDELKKLIPRE